MPLEAVDKKEILDQLPSRVRMVVVVPLTSRDKKQPLHVPLKAADSGLPIDSFIKTEDLRGISKERLTVRAGQADAVAMQAVEARVKRLLGLD